MYLNGKYLLSKNILFHSQPNYRLQLTALAASASSFLYRAANDRAAAEAER